MVARAVALVVAVAVAVLVLKVVARAVTRVVVGGSSFYNNYEKVFTLFNLSFLLYLLQVSQLHLLQRCVLFLYGEST